MSSESKRINYLLDRRAGIEEDFSVPETTTYLHRTNQPSGRDAPGEGGGCHIA